MLKETLVPEFPMLALAVTGVPVGLVTAEVASGLTVVQERVCVQLLPLIGTVQDGEAGVRVPDMPAFETTTVALLVSVPAELVQARVYVYVPGVLMTPID